MSEYPDVDGERREEDDMVVVRIAREIAWWWNRRIGKIAQTVTVFSFFGSIATGIALGLIGFGTLRAEFADLPEQVSRLDQRMDRQRDSVIVPAVRRIEVVEGDVRHLEGRVDQVASDMNSMREMVGDLRDLAVSNNCWIRVAAGEESRFNCTLPPPNPD